MQTKYFWDSFYKDQDKQNISNASSFAHFVGNFIDSEALVIDLGCGNGRDSRFLNQFNDVVGIDQSDVAIEFCKSQRLLDVKKVKTLAFRSLLIEDENLCDIFKTEIIKSEQNNVFIYARFFLHAINKFEYEKFWEFAQCLNLDFSVSVGVEFRTEEDKENFKLFPDHFRNFLDPSSVVSDAELRGFKVRALYQGYGLAKYKDEDPHVARIIFE